MDFRVGAHVIVIADDTLTVFTEILKEIQHTSPCSVQGKDSTRSLGRSLLELY